MSTAAEPRRPAIDVAVDVGFAVLLLVCGYRYFSRHPFDGVGIAAFVLAVGAGLSYAIAVIGWRHGAGQRAGAVRGIFETRQGVGLLLATAFWLPLVVLAPSFGWCGFALFFAVHRVIRGPLAYVITGAIVVAVSGGLLLMSKGDDLGLVLGPFFGGLVLAYAYSALDRSLEQQRQLNAQLIETREQLARSERDAGALAERERVASELHDTVVQRTATALLMLESDDLGPGVQTSAVRDARDALREGLIETRQLLHGLTDPRMSSAQLVPALASQSQAAGAEFSVAGTERAVSDAISYALQRVVQEALTNIQKHADARSIYVTLTFFGSEIGVDIVDDGVGFTPTDTPTSEPDSLEAGSGGFGLRAMIWRIHALGGTLTIESRPGDGTVIAAVVPTGLET